MKRKALLIANPGSEGDENYCRGVYADLSNFREYLTSPRGGVWYENEIETLDKPMSSVVKEKVASLGSFDYSFIAFFGHGYYSAAKMDTVLELNPFGGEITSNQLKINAKKRTIVLDCCRVVIKDAILSMNNESCRSALKKAVDLDLAAFRKKFDDEVTRVGDDLIVTYGCSTNEKAGDSPTQGGRYTSSLLHSVANWSPDLGVTSSDVMSVVAAHNAAAPLVQNRSGGLQNPDIEKSRTLPYFPFAVAVR